MLDSLRRIPFLKELSAGQLERLGDFFEEYACPAGTVIFEQGQRATHLYIILQGGAALRYKPYDGPPLVLTHLREGDVFGWSAAIGRPSYTTAIHAESLLKAARIGAGELKRLCLEDPIAGALLLDRLAEAVSPRWKDARAQVQAILQQNLRRQGEPDGDGAAFNMSFSRDAPPE